MAEEVVDAAIEEGPPPEVSGSTLTLEEAISDGSVPVPDLMPYNQWLAWRAQEGSRPVRRRGDVRTTSSAQESELWRATMQDIYGGDWAEQLAARGSGTTRGQEAVGSSAPPAPGAGASAGTRVLVEAQGSQGASSGSVTPQELKPLIEQEFDSRRETFEAWKSRVVRLVSRAEALGEELPPEFLHKVVGKGEYLRRSACSRSSVCCCRSITKKSSVTNTNV